MDASARHHEWRTIAVSVRFWTPRGLVGRDVRLTTVRTSPGGCPVAIGTCAGHASGPHGRQVDGVPCNPRSKVQESHAVHDDLSWRPGLPALDLVAVE
jgi:hypothetical protein